MEQPTPQPTLPERLRQAGEGAEPLRAGPWPASAGPCLIALGLDWIGARSTKGVPGWSGLSDSPLAPAVRDICLL